MSYAAFSEFSYGYAMTDNILHSGLPYTPNATRFSLAARRRRRWWRIRRLQERRVPPDWLGDICLHVATLLASFASIYYVYRDLRKGSHKRAQADGIPPVTHR
jgi:hypothetical protein